MLAVAGQRTRSSGSVQGDCRLFYGSFLSTPGSGHNVENFDATIFQPRQLKLFVLIFTPKLWSDVLPLQTDVHVQTSWVTVRVRAGSSCW